MNVGMCEMCRPETHALGNGLRLPICRIVRKMKVNRMKTILLLFIFLFSFGISWDFGLAADDKPDYWPTKGWRSASPESQGIDSTFFVNMLDTIWDNDFAIDAVMVSHLA